MKNVTGKLKSTARIHFALFIFQCSFFILPANPLTADEPPAVVNSLGMRFVPIAAGEFHMGSPDDDAQAADDERPQHAVRIDRPFYLGAYEVAQAEFELVMGENPSWFGPHGGGRDEITNQPTGRLPVEMVSWDEAVLFCRRLGERPEEQAAGRTYRLPTEAEWEYACRAGTTTRFAWADVLTAVEANVVDPTADPPRPQVTRPVGSYLANPWGLYDMHGNVWEWCADRYDADYYATFAPGTTAVDPRGPADGTGRVVRGGDYRFAAHEARSANRDYTRASRRDWGNGFRVVLIPAAL